MNTMLKLRIPKTTLEMIRIELIPDLLNEIRGLMSLSIPIKTSHLRSSVPKIRTINH